MYVGLLNAKDDDCRNFVSDECVGKCVPEPSER